MTTTANRHPSTTPTRVGHARTAPNPARTIRLRIKRCEGPGKPSRWETFAVRLDAGTANPSAGPAGAGGGVGSGGGGGGGGGANVISVLQQVAANPVTIDGQRTTPVVWDSGCLEEVCGACTMVINGRVRQSCSCLIDEYAPNDGDEITLEPMTKFPVIRDLWVDRARLFHNLRRVKAWVPIDGTYHLGSGPREKPEQQETRYKLSECMSCGCCLEACPQFNLEPDAAAWDEAFLGAHAISQARLFNLHDTGKALAPARLDALAGPGGIADCGNAQNCVKVCPKNIPLTESIAAMGRAVTIHAVTKFFTRK